MEMEPSYSETGALGSLFEQAGAEVERKVSWQGAVLQHFSTLGTLESKEQVLCPTCVPSDTGAVLQGRTLIAGLTQGIPISPSSRLQSDLKKNKTSPTDFGPFAQCNQAYTSNTLYVLPDTHEHCVEKSGFKPESHSVQGDAVVTAHLNFNNLVRTRSMEEESCIAGESVSRHDVTATEDSVHSRTDPCKSQGWFPEVFHQLSAVCHMQNHTSTTLGLKTPSHVGQCTVAVVTLDVSHVCQHFVSWECHGTVCSGDVHASMTSHVVLLGMSYLVQHVSVVTPCVVVDGWSDPAVEMLEHVCCVWSMKESPSCYGPCTAHDKDQDEVASDGPPHMAGHGDSISLESSSESSSHGTRVTLSIMIGSCQLGTCARALQSNCFEQPDSPEVRSIVPG